MANKDVRVELHGVRELNKAFKEIDKALSTDMRLAFKAIAQGIADDVKPKVPYKSGKARASVKPRATQKGASVAVGGPNAPHYPWLDFGGKIKRAERPFVKSGRYLYPTIAEHRDEIIKETDKALQEIISKAGFKQKGDND